MDPCAQQSMKVGLVWEADQGFMSPDTQSLDFTGDKCAVSSAAVVAVDLWRRLLISQAVNDTTSQLNKCDFSLNEVDRLVGYAPLERSKSQSECLKPITSDLSIHSDKCLCAGNAALDPSTSGGRFRAPVIQTVVGAQ